MLKPFMSVFTEPQHELIIGTIGAGAAGYYISGPMGAFVGATVAHSVISRIRCVPDDFDEKTDYPDDW